MSSQSIDITRNIKNRSSIAALSGRSLGEQQRSSLKIDDAIKTNDKIIIIVPKNIYSISSSFFLGMFGDIVRELKTKEAFLNRVNFKCSKSIDNNINDGIQDALNNVDALI